MSRGCSCTLSILLSCTYFGVKQILINVKQRATYLKKETANEQISLMQWVKGEQMKMHMCFGKPRKHIQQMMNQINIIYSENKVLKYTLDILTF